MERNITIKQENLPAFSLVSQDKLAKAIQGFGEDYRNLVICRHYNANNLMDAVSDNAPTFLDISNFFGDDATRFWLRLHIAEAFAFVGIYDTSSKFQIQQTADLIMQHEIYGQFTLSEFLTFLNRFKRGDYGKVYNSTRPNPQEFLVCLRQFWQDLSYARGRHEEQLKADRLSQEKRSAPITDEQQQHVAEVQQRIAEKFNLNIK